MSRQCEQTTLGQASEARLTPIFLLSALILYLEMLLIRLISVEINIFSYLQNAVLIVCLFAVALGCLAQSGTKKVTDALVPLVILAACLFLPIVGIAFRKCSLFLSVFHDFGVWQQWIAASPSDAFLGTLSGIATVFVVVYLLWAVMYPLGIVLGG